MSNTNETIQRFLGEPLKNVAHSLCDQYIETNVKFRSRSGMKTFIIRRELANCCDWCRSLAGIYDYDTAPREVYQRHDSCRCMVTFKTDDGKYVDVWSKKEYQSQRAARIERNIEISKSNKLDALNKAKAIARAEEKLFIDSTEIRLNNKYPVGKVTDAKFFKHEKKKLWVDRRNVVFEPSEEERKTAQLLAEKLGGHIELLPRVNYPENIRSADYVWNGIKLERKAPTGSGKQTIFNQIKEIEGQANYVALDISKTRLSEEQIKSDLEKAFKYRSCNHLDMAIVIKNDEILYILERV